MSEELKQVAREAAVGGQAGVSTRRGFACGLGLFSASVVLGLGSSAYAASGPAMVTVVEFGADGKPTGKQKVPRVVKTNAEWQQQLSPLSFQVARLSGTERAFTGPDWDEHGNGLFRCICCNNALFSSETKFDSGTGWPSFWQPLAKENIIETTDGSLGMSRTAVSCRLCEAHLGHVFDDGPRPTGLRYCMNAAAMHFVKLA